MIYIALAICSALAGFAFARIRLRDEITALRSTIRFLENSQHLEGRYRQAEGAIDVGASNVIWYPWGDNNAA